MPYKLKDNSTTFMATEVIARLEAMVTKYGDQPVFLRDPDTSWRLPIGLKFRDKDRDHDFKRFEICADYVDGSIPDGGYGTEI